MKRNVRYLVLLAALVAAPLAVHALEKTLATVLIIQEKAVSFDEANSLIAAGKVRVTGLGVIKDPTKKVDTQATITITPDVPGAPEAGTGDFSQQLRAKTSDLPGKAVPLSDDNYLKTLAEGTDLILAQPALNDPQRGAIVDFFEVASNKGTERDRLLGEGSYTGKGLPFQLVRVKDKVGATIMGTLVTNFLNALLADLRGDADDLEDNLEGVGAFLNAYTGALPNTVKDALKAFYTNTGLLDAAEDKDRIGFLATSIALFATKETASAATRLQPIYFAFIDMASKPNMLREWERFGGDEEAYTGTVRAMGTLIERTPQNRLTYTPIKTKFQTFIDNAAQENWATKTDNRRDAFNFLAEKARDKGFNAPAIAVE